MNNFELINELRVKQSMNVQRMQAIIWNVENFSSDPTYLALLAENERMQEECRNLSKAQKQQS